MVGLGFQVEECQVRYNVDKVAAAPQGAEYTSSDTATAADCYQAEREISQLQGKGQSKQVHCLFVCVTFGY